MFIKVQINPPEVQQQKIPVTPQHLEKTVAGWLTPQELRATAPEIS